MPMQLVLPSGKRMLELDVEVPMDAVDYVALLPTIRRIVDTLVEEAATAGASLCRAGCSSCCRRMVPVSASEARAIAAIVETAEPSRQAALRASFADARTRLAQAGVSLPAVSGIGADRLEPRALEVAYRAAAVPCPFLEDGRCAIYEMRPLACRDRTATSAASECVASHDAIRVPELPAARTAAALFDAEGDHEGVTWVPLVTALEFAAHRPASGRVRLAPELLWPLLEHCGTPALG